MASNTPVFKIAVPWLLSASGLMKFARTRALHVPQSRLQDACDHANDVVQSNAPGSPQISPAMWRAVEATQIAILQDGIESKIP